MSAVILDTHAFIWWATNAPQLSDRARQKLSDGQTTLMLSSVVPWEMAIKLSLGRLKLHDSLTRIVRDQIVRHAMLELPIRIEHSLAVEVLPRHHTDPFDRLLIAQAMVERASIVTVDPEFAQYGVAVVW